MSQYDRAIRRFDDANDRDPRRVDDQGDVVGAEVLYSRRMTAWLERLEPEASEELWLAVRAQHIGRWQIPRDRYPSGRTGYKQWRSELARHHADVAGRILREVGYAESRIARVEALIRKQRLKTDAEAQTLEDVACLVFLEHYLADFATKHDDAKLVDIIRKTWRKMSERGQKAALALELPEDLAALVERAVAADGD